MKQIVFALALSLALGACCGPSHLRYWKATDLNSGKDFYAADTASWPLQSNAGMQFISSEGKLVSLSNYELEAITSGQWVEESGGTVHAEMVNIPNQGLRCVARVTARRRPIASE